MKNNRFYIGMMSGTSMDGVDVVLMDCEPMSQNQPPRLHAHVQLPPPPALKTQVQAIMQHKLALTAQEWGNLDLRLAAWFGEAVRALWAKTDIPQDQINAIGSHGQTVWHEPPQFTMQLGAPQTLATQTQCRVIADFRTRDMAYGGQGAPLVPAFHAALWQSEDEARVILNLGGIANISYLPQKNIKNIKNNFENILGFDTGPANGLMDAWCEKNIGLPFDKNGDWAKSGTIQENLVQNWLNDPYFHKTPPKSTGREYFNLNWLKKNTPNLNLYLPEDIQASLLALTARSVANAILAYDAARVIVCGGGRQNAALMDALVLHLPNIAVESSEKWGLDSQQIEAAAFAWLAWQYDLRQPANLPSVTGASQACVLGVEYLP